MSEIVVVGMGMSAKDLTTEQQEIIASSQILMGGQRHLDQFSHLTMEKQAITGKVEQTIGFIKAHRMSQRIVVLASGDPLFYGIGARISEALGREQVTVLPNITSIAAAFSRIKEPWSNARIISLHGRENKYKLLEALKYSDALAVLTDRKHSPQWLARWLLDKGAEHLRMAVFQKLGMPEEEHGWFDLNDTAGLNFDHPNVVILKSFEDGSTNNALVLGMAEQNYYHKEGLITKSEVRAVALSKLQLKPGQILWDLGAGSGSVGIEASVLIGAGRVIAVEQHVERVADIRRNARRYRVFNHDTVHAQLPGGLEALPLPDRIFVGGGGRDLANIVRSAAGYLNPGGRLVANTVLLDNLTRITDVLNSDGMTVDVVQIQVSRSKEMPWSCRFEAGSPVWIITSEKI